MVSDGLLIKPYTLYTHSQLLYIIDEPMLTDVSVVKSLIPTGDSNCDFPYNYLIICKNYDEEILKDPSADWYDGTWSYLSEEVGEADRIFNAALSRVNLKDFPERREYVMSVLLLGKSKLYGKD